jgi:hypothetical protein
VLIDLLTIMFDSDGELTLNGEAYPLNALGKRLGLDPETLEKTLATLMKYGAISQNDTGIYYSDWIKDRIDEVDTMREKRSRAGKASAQAKKQHSVDSVLQQEVNKDSTQCCECVETKGQPSISISNNINKQQNAGARTRTREGHMPDDAEQAVAMAFGKTEASEEFIRQAFYQAAALDFQDGRGNQIRNWPAHVQAFWNNSRNKERKETARLEAMKKRPASANRTSSALVPAEGIIKANC